MLFFTFFQQLAEKNQHITIELKNDLQISGVLHSVDQYLNIKLTNISVNNPEKYPHLVSFAFILVQKIEIK
ncbi:U6 snRNA-associated Sm-like protein LSm2 [Plasmodium yoelii yoelii]|uniref:U6 snRNA-associated Sm-like protein LSm2 n=1 Tax=Plasmodium yoelii yoelii TaxID=73239 RepID=A0AAE9WSA7_PLAYO|nr:U6 snRNA-associated Sm-like protein LSm2 [Plasmodium yoelii yoelii]